VIGRRRVPVLFQSSNAECGSACLAMVLGYHGYRTSVREVREWCPPGRDGISAGALVRTARGAGLATTAYRASAAVLRNAELPAIAHWQDNHSSSSPTSPAARSPSWIRRSAGSG